MEICPAYISKCNSICQKQITLLMSLLKAWHYLAVTRLPALLRRITSNNNGDFSCLSCLHSFRTKYKLKSREKVCKIKDFCGTVLSPQKDISKFNQYMKSNKTLESLIKKTDNCKNNPEKSSTTKIGEHIPCGYLMSTI